MSNSIGSAVPAQLAVQIKVSTQSASQPSPSAAHSQSSPSASSDIVKISSAAQQLIQESLENSVQTAKEAAGGDPQAKRLLAREAADSALAK